jgi:hypothetical protein
LDARELAALSSAEASPAAWLTMGRVLLAEYQTLFGQALKDTAGGRFTFLNDSNLTVARDSGRNDTALGNGQCGRDDGRTPERTLACNDSELKIDWGLDGEPIGSAKDQGGGSLANAETFDWSEFPNHASHASGRHWTSGAASGAQPSPGALRSRCDSEYNDSNFR